MSAATQPPLVRRPRVVCSNEVRQAAPHLIVEALPPMVLKGRDEPVVAYRVLGMHRDSQLETRMPRLRETLGRDSELSTNNAFIERLCDGVRGTIVVEGEPGIGKSTFMADSIRKARALGGIRCLVGTASAIERSTPYFVWRRVFAALLLGDGADAAIARRHIEAELATLPELVPLLPLLSVVLPFSWPDNEFTQHLSGEVRAENTRRLLLGVLHHHAQRGPHLIVLESAQWFDSSSWALLRAVCLSKEMVVMMSTRPLTPLPVEMEQILALRSTLRLHLKPLAVEGAQALLTRRLRAPVPRTLVTWIHTRGGGNPFYMEQLIETLLEAGAVQVEHDTCRVRAELSSIKLPDTLEGIVATRIDRLRANEQLTVRVASVIGRYFSTVTLRDVYPLDAAKEELDAHLIELERAQIAVPQSEVAGSDYFFQHAIIHEVAYGQLLEEQRRALHRNIAQWYEVHFASDLSPHYELLAWHYQRADNLGKALDYLEYAIERALRAHANQEAIALIKQALAFVEQVASVDMTRRARLERQQGDAWHGLGDLQRSAEHLEQALKVLNRPTPTSYLGLAVVVIAQVFLQVAHRLLPRAIFVASSAHREDTLEATRAYLRLSEVLYYLNRLPHMAYAVVLSVNQAERANTATELSRGYSAFGVLCAAVPVRRVAHFYMQRSVEIARAVADPEVLAFCLATRGLCLYGFGDLSAACVDLEEGDALAIRIANHRRREEIEGMWSKALLGLGELSRAAEIRRTYAQLAKEHDHPQPRAWGLLGQFVDVVTVRAPDETYCEYPEEAWRIAERLSAQGDKIYALGLCAVARRCWGFWSGSLDAATRAIELMEHNEPSTVYALEGYCGAVESAIALLHRAQLEGTPDNTLMALATRGCRELLRFARVYVVARPRALLFQGWLFHRKGRDRQARAATRQSLAEAIRLKVPYDQARALRQLARLGEVESQARATAIAARLSVWMGWINYLELGT